MTLSEAIRLGAMLRPQGVGDFFVVDRASGRMASCALGAAMEAIGITPISGIQDTAFDQFKARWPWCWTQSEHCPQCRVFGRLDAVISHLNDNHHWTRERIADWIAIIDPLEREPTVDQSEVSYV